MPISPDELAAYFNAAVAVTAFDFDLPVRRISLTVRAGRRDRPQLASLKQYIASRVDRFNCIDSAADYVTVLLSGPVGRVLALENYLAYKEPHLEVARLERGYLEEARLCREPATDTAMAVTVAWLKNYNGGNWDATFVQLWHRADLLLRSDAHQSRVKKMVQEIKKRRCLIAEEIHSIMVE